MHMQLDVHLALNMLLGHAWRHCSVTMALRSKYFRTGVVEKILFVSSRAAPRTCSSHWNSLLFLVSSHRVVLVLSIFLF